MRRNEPNVTHFSLNDQENLSFGQLDSRVSDARSDTYASSNQSPSVLQFFVRMPEGYNLVMEAYSNDTVRSLHEKIHSLTGIPVIEQRLIYRRKELHWEQNLAECSIEKDAGLQLLGCLRSTQLPQYWQIMNDMVSMVCGLCRNELHFSAFNKIKRLMSDYFEKISKVDIYLAKDQLQVFMSSSAPTALVMLYMSPIMYYKDIGEDCIRHFISLSSEALYRPFHYLCGPIMLEFCILLRRVGNNNILYLLCRDKVTFLLQYNDIMSLRGSTPSDNISELNVVQEIFTFVNELAEELSMDLVSSMEVKDFGPSAKIVHDFTVFLIHFRTVFNCLDFQGSTSVDSDGKGFMPPTLFIDLLDLMSKCLQKVEEYLVGKWKVENDLRWTQYLAILKELNVTYKLYPGAEKQFWKVLRHRKSSFCWLILNYAKIYHDHMWILEHKEMLDFECRRHLALMMFPKVKQVNEDMHEMLIDRSQLLPESFEYITSAEPESLHRGLVMGFKNEEAAGVGVLREWFVLVCQAIFSPQNALFVACPKDPRRFFPNYASKMEPLDLKYFNFAGRVIALVLMHRVQIGIVFDSVFFLQLAGNTLITLEDIRDADPCLYDGCKKILEMDPELVDKDILGLTFVRETEELGSRRIVELCPGGKSIVVNSKNRKDYVTLLIQNQFVTSISEQVSHFAKGFADILCNSKLQNFFFQSLDLEDLDSMLYGGEGAVSVEDWKAHTEYYGYKETDSQIIWFWKIVEEMSAEQRRVLLFFWTSFKYLPVEGFCGLRSLEATQLCIYKSLMPFDHLPSSHTCFYRLCFPPYPSMDMMRDRLSIITQEHIGSSFGAW